MHRALPLVSLVAAVLAGCGESTLDASDTERAIRGAVREQVGAAVSRVECPDGVAARTGGTFTCTITGKDGTRGKARVTQTDDQGHVSVRAPFVDTRPVERQVARGLEEQSGAGRVRLKCPEIVPVRAGSAFTCRVRAGGSSARVRVTQQDRRGRVRWELLRS